VSASAGLKLWALLAALGVQGCRQEPSPEQPGALTGGASSSPTVYFQDLKAFLPTSLEGFTQVRERGSTGKYGEVSVSEAERVFREAGSEARREVSVRIVDTTLSQRLGRSIREAVKDGARKARSDPLAPIQLQDALGFLRYDPEEEQAEANLLVGDRYVVAVTTRGFNSTVEAREIARGLDLSGLAQLR